MKIPRRVVASFGHTDSWYDFDTYPRVLTTDINGGNKADVVGFGSTRVYLSYSNGKDTSGNPKNYGGLVGSLNYYTPPASAGSWTSYDLYPRFVENTFK